MDRMEGRILETLVSTAHAGFVMDIASLLHAFCMTPENPVLQDPIDSEYPKATQCL